MPLDRYIAFDQDAIEKDLNSPEEVITIWDTEQTLSVERMMEILNNMSNSKPLEPKFDKILNDNFLDLL